VLAPVSNEDMAGAEEIFGPVVAVIPFDDEDDARSPGQRHPYGLSGSIWTRTARRPCASRGVSRPACSP
jgi:phenylacetaldehyde dehydrogenase